MRIQHNIAALNAYRNLGVNNTGVSKNLEKLSSGYRINRAGDDAAGLAISEKMRSQITGLNTATKNANDGISLVQTAEGALTEVHSMLNRMVEIATQSSNGVYEDGVDRAALQDEMNALTDEIDRIADGTNFNKKNLLDGKIGKSVTGAMTGTVTSADTTAAVSLSVEFTTLYKDAGLGISIINNGGKQADAFAKDEAKIVDGVLQLKLNGTQDYKSDEIAQLIKNADVSSVAEADQAALKATLASAKIDGIITGGTTDADNNTFSSNTLAATATEAGKTGEYTLTNNSMSLQIGDTNAEHNKLKVTVSDMHASSIGVGKEDVSVKSEEEAGKAVDRINNAINMVSTQRGKLGAIQNRLEHTINNLSVNAENMTAAESRIRDVDMAKEMMDYTKNNILVQASQAMLAQANQVPQGVLQLLQ